MRTPGPFTWLLNIRLGYHLFRREMECWIEPYTPSRFTRQFGYDQLYVGNPNPGLNVRGTLLAGARVWFYSIIGGTEATFSLPSSQPRSLYSLNFCCWFWAATGIEAPPSFLTNLGEGSTDAPMGTPDVGVKESIRKAPTGTDPNRAISASSSQIRSS